MSFLQFSKLSLAFGDRDIFKDVSINIQKGTKAALTGGNGEGKSTLLKAMAGIIEADSGSRAIQKNTRIVYVPQSGIVHRGLSLSDEAKTAFQFGLDLQKKIDALGDEIKKNCERQNSLLEEQADLIRELDESGWHRRKAEAQTILLALGFSKSDLEKQTENFSGGWQMRIALAKALMQKPDILLLDEPTNYLDIEARTWLENFLQNYAGAFVLVSHDRYFLDVSVNEVYELFRGNLKRYAGNFSHYESVRKTELATLMKEYEKQQEEIHHLEDFIRRFGAKATKASQAQERQKMLDKIVRIEIPEQMKKIHFSFPSAPHAGKIILQANDISKTWNGKDFIFSHFNLTIENGERLVVVGKNGAGKSTLLRMLAGVDKNFSGEINFGTGVRVGYFSQDSAEQIFGKTNILEYFENCAPLELVPKLRDMLASFLFRGDDVYKSLNVLSGGEKSRLALLRLLLSPVNFLILDEPTNHLDLHSKDVLLDALRDFGGTIIFVSHDRDFMQALSNKVLDLDGEAREYPGDYEYFLEQKTKLQNASESFVQAKTSEKTATQVSWEEAKKVKAEKQKREKMIARLENEMSTLENEKKILEEKLNTPEVYTDGNASREVQKRLSEIDKTLSEKMSEWEKLMNDAE